MILVMNLRQTIYRLSSNSPQKEEVTTINPCILYSHVFRKPSSDVLPPLCKASIARFSWGPGRCNAPVGPVQSPGGGPGSKAPGSSDNTVIYSTIKGSKIPLSW